MAKVTIDGVDIEVPNGSALIQACELAGKEIPRFCYHERLSVAGNCRMCLVEVEKAPKPVASCAFPVTDGMVVKTDSPMVREARRGVMEFLLVNHPLDCPICDQGGECDLQDQAMAYGRDGSRFAENKRAVKDKDLGPLVKTVMTRCIQCTRCIRFASEVAGVPELGATARGENMEVGTYVEKALSSELSGNLIDICPVGALTSKPQAYAYRPWELKKTDGIDALDATGSNISIQTRGNEVIRIIPRMNDAVNEEWMADKGRFSIDGLLRRRLDRPWIRRDGKLHPATWAQVLETLAARFQITHGDRIGAIIGDLCDAESMLLLKELMQDLHAPNIDCRQDGARGDVSRRDFYSFNSGIDGIEDADALLLVGTNLRREAPVINARIRKRLAAPRPFPIAAIGEPVDLTYHVDWLGTGPDALLALKGRNAFFEILKKAERPMIVVGQGALRRADGDRILAACWALAQQVGALTADWHGFNVLQTAASRVGALDLGLVPGTGGKDVDGMLEGGVDLLWLLGADEFDINRIGPQTFTIYQGHHGDRGAARADVILPGAAYTEKNGTWVNTEGRVQRGFQAVFAPGEAQEDWKIVRAVSEALGKPLPYNDLETVRRRLVRVNPVFGSVGEKLQFGASDLTAPAVSSTMSSVAFASVMPNYYQTDPISRASQTMSQCVKTHGLSMEITAE